MKPEDIEVGKTYVNAGDGRTRRKVIAIGDQDRPPNWHGASEPDEEPIVLFEQDIGSGNTLQNVRRNLYLTSFAKWAEREA